MLPGVPQHRAQLVRRHGLAQAVVAMGGHHAVPAGGPAERRLVRPAAADPDRNPGLLHRAGPHGHVLGGQVLAVHGDRFAAPQRVEQVQRLIQPGGPFLSVPGLTERGELPGVRAKPGAEHQPPAGQVVQRHRLPGHLAHPAAGQHVDQDAQPDPGGPRGDRGDHHDRIGDGPLRVGPQLVVPDEEAVPAVFFGRHGQLHQQHRVAERPDIGHAHRAGWHSAHSVTLVRGRPRAEAA